MSIPQSGGGPIEHHSQLAEYRAKWGLPADYPMVAPRYAEVRSKLAKQIGLGTKSGKRLKARSKLRG